MSINLGKKLTGLALFLAVSASGAYASTLSEVQINATDTGYAVVLKTDSAAQMKKVVSSPNKMYIELKGVQAAEDLNTVYNNVANIDNVTIQPVSKDDLKITLQGEGISSSKVYFEEAKTLPAAADSSESIELSGPVSSYTPVYPKKYVEEIDQTANPQVNAALTKMHINRGMVVGTKSVLSNIANKAKDSNMLVIFGILIAVGAFLFRPKKKEQNKIQIGLSQGMRTAQTQREIGLAQKLSQPALSPSRASAAPVSNYGMKAYQQSLKNPYMTSNTAPQSTGVSGIPRKPVAARRPVSSPKPVAKAPAAPMPQRTPAMQNTIQSKIPSTATLSQNQANAANIDSVKFLESITRIYEKNGRKDLAKGLKDNLKKAQYTNTMG